MMHVRTEILVTILCLMLPTLVPRIAAAHPWHRHRDGDGSSHDDADADGTASPRPPTADRRFLLTAAAKPTRAKATDIAEAFEPFVDLRALSCRSDDRYFYVESNGIPDHPLMVGIRAWQQQVPLPQKYTGENAWRIPLEPVPAATPVTTKDRFLRGAIALAVNGVPIFNPLNNRGEDAFLIGELDDYGGHCGRADDYHYHVAPVHLEKQVGKGMPIAYALDGYPIYGYTEPDGSPVRGLDRCNGHEDADGNYHYHATKAYPYLNGGFHGEVTERDGQVDPQPRAEPVRPALQPLRGATIVGFTSPTPTSRQLTYEVGGRKGFVEYKVGGDGTLVFDYTDPSGKKTTETYTPRGRGQGGRGGPGPRGEVGPGRDRGDRPPRPGDERQRRGPPSDDRPPPPGSPDDRPPPPQSGVRRPAGRARSSSAIASGAQALTVTSSAIGPDGSLPLEFTCDGAGVSPPVEWQAGPPGTKSYAISLWHEAPDQVKSYWVVYGIPEKSTQLAQNSRTVGTMGLNDKNRAEYDPMCSKGPGVKTYHITVYALSAVPTLRPHAATRDALLDAIKDITLAEGTLTYTYERGAR
jgi:phosphatidylethanolamine-binding protein (PEBP) family uncharacterized protein